MSQLRFQVLVGREQTGRPSLLTISVFCSQVQNGATLVHHVLSVAYNLAALGHSHVGHWASKQVFDTDGHVDSWSYLGICPAG